MTRSEKAIETSVATKSQGLDLALFSLGQIDNARARHQIGRVEFLNRGEPSKTTGRFAKVFSACWA